MSNQQNIYFEEARKLIGYHLKDDSQLETLHTYTTAEGAPIFWRLRLKTKDGKKMFPMHQTSNGDFILKEPNFNQEKKPLYRLHELTSRNHEPIYVVEGEKCADKLATLGLLATTSGSAGSAAHADWSPLRNRTVVIWPDSDTPGLKYADNVSQTLSDIDCIVSQIDIAELNLTEHQDCVDWLEKHPSATKSDIEKLNYVITQISYPRFELRKEGVFYCKDTDNAEWICSYLIVKALTRDDDSVNWGRVLELEDVDRIIHQWTMPAELLAGNDELAKELLRLGLRIAPGHKTRKLLIEYITNAETYARARCVLSTGWHEHCYVFPNKTIGNTHELVIFQHDGRHNDNYAVAGTLEEWQKHVSQICIGNSRLVFSICAAFASPLLKILGMENGGFHFRGESSTGKTTALTIAASVWGSRNYVQNWRATDNGLEGIAMQHNDALLILDELSQVDPKYAGEIAYMLANGQGKARASKTGSARQRYHWRLIFLSSGEISLESHMLEAGKHAKAGQEVRMIDIPADASAGLGIFENLHDYTDAAVFSEALKTNCDKYHGIASEQFIEQLTASDPVALHTKIQNIQHTFTDLLPEAPHGQVKRVAQRFALVAAAGELASEYGITGWPPRIAIDAAQICFKAWLDSRDANNSSLEKQKILEQVEHFFQKNVARFDVFDSVEGYQHKTIPQNCAGYIANNGDFYVFPETFRKEICKGIGTSKEVSKIIIGCHWLLPDKNNGHPCTSVWVPTQSKTIRLYHFSSAITGEDKK